MAHNRVTLNSLREKFKLTYEDCNKQVSDYHLVELSQTHCRNWRQLPPYLNMNSIVEHDIERSSTDEKKKRNDFFKEWREIEGSAATYNALANALLMIDSRNDAEYVCQMAQHASIHSPPSTFAMRSSEWISKKVKKVKFLAVIVILVLGLILAKKLLASTVIINNTNTINSLSSTLNSKDPQCQIQGIRNLILDTPSNIYLNLHGQIGDLGIDAHLYYYYPVAIPVKQITSEEYNIMLSFTPKHRGKHELRIKHDGKHICGSPVPLYVAIPPHQLKQMTSVYMDQVGGLRFHEGKICACQVKKAIKIIDILTFSVEKSITFPGVGLAILNHPFIYATNVLMNSILKLTMDGQTIASTTLKVGTDFIGDLSGIRFSKNNELYVCDTSNFRIQIFDKNLHLLRVIGDRNKIQLSIQVIDAPFIGAILDIDFDEEGNIYALDIFNDQIQVLTPNGQHIQNIGEHELDFPVSLQIHRGMIYVTDKDHVLVYKTSGELITKFGEFQSPEGIAIDDNGYVYVAHERRTIAKL